MLLILKCNYFKQFQLPFAKYLHPLSPTLLQPYFHINEPRARLSKWCHSAIVMYLQPLSPILLPTTWFHEKPRLRILILCSFGRKSYLHPLSLMLLLSVSPTNYIRTKRFLEWFLTVLQSKTYCHFLWLQQRHL